MRRGLYNKDLSYKPYGNKKNVRKVEKALKHELGGVKWRLWIKLLKILNLLPDFTKEA